MKNNQPLENWQLAAGVTPAHTKIVENWHLKPSEILHDLNYSALSARETRKATGCDTPSIALEYDDLDGNPTKLARWRLADPTKVPFGAKSRKYTGKKGDPPALFLPRGLKRRWRYYAEHPNKVIYITEGEAKALFATLRFHIPCIAVQGCSGWQAQGIPAEQFAWFDWKDRPVIIIPDSDYRKNPEIRRWFAKLGKHLASLGANVKFRLLPDLIVDKEHPEKSKTGLDDYAAILHADLEAFRQLTTLPLAHPWIQHWDRDDSQLPAALHDLSPNTADWLASDPPPLSYIIRSYLQKGEVAQVAGQAGVSKSTWTIQAAASLAGGVPFFGVENTITRAYRVLYLMLERASDSFQRRWRKGVDHIGNGIKADGDRAKFYRTVTANFTAKALAGQTLGLVEWKKQEWVQTPAVDALIAQIIAAAVEIIFFDPLSRLYNGVEDGAVQAAIIRVFERITQETGCSVVFVHHSGIVQREGVYTGRGSSQLTDNTSETIAFKEFKGADREKLGNYKAALWEGEENAAIVQVDHVRAADGPLNSIMQFVRSPDTGLLRRITTIGQKEAGDRIRDWITDNAQFHKWVTDRQFTQTELVRARTTALGEISERDAKSLFAAATKADVFREAGQRNGYPIYKWKTPSGATGAHHSAPLHHSKKRGDKHVH